MGGMAVRRLDVRIGSSLQRNDCFILFRTATNPNNIRTLDDMIIFTKSHPEENCPSRDIGRWLNALHAAALPSEDIRRRREKSLRCSKEDGILGAMELWDLDVSIAPSVFTASTTFAAQASLSIATVP